MYIYMCICTIRVPLVTAPEREPRGRLGLPIAVIFRKIGCLRRCTWNTYMYMWIVNYCVLPSTCLFSLLGKLATPFIWITSLGSAIGYVQQHSQCLHHVTTIELCTMYTCICTQCIYKFMYMYNWKTYAYTCTPIYMYMGKMYQYIVHGLNYLSYNAGGTKVYVYTLETFLSFKYV